MLAHPGNSHSRAKPDMNALQLNAQSLNFSFTLFFPFPLEQSFRMTFQVIGQNADRAGG